MDVRQEYEKKLCTAREAVKVVRSGDWIDYGWNACAPAALDEALAERYQELKDVKVRGAVLMKRPAILSVPDTAEHFIWNSWHMSGLERKLIDEGIEFVNMGGTMDFTAGDDGAVAKLIAQLVNERGVPMDNITLSSDAFGSQPRFNDKGVCIGLTYASPRTLHAEIKHMLAEGLPLEEALKVLTVNPARMMKLQGVKGEISVGADADMIVFGEDMAIDTVIARGKIAVCKGEAVMKGRFE